MVRLPIAGTGQKHTIIVGLLAALLFSACLAVTGNSSVSAAADTCTWTGLGADTDVTTAGNWTGCDNGTVPESEDTVVFPNSATNKIVNLDNGQVFENVTFSGSNYTVNSPNPSLELGVFTDFTISGNNNTFNARIRIYPETTSTFTYTGTGNTIAENMIIQPNGATPDVIFDIENDLTIPMLAQSIGWADEDTIRSFTKRGDAKLAISGVAITGVTTTDEFTIAEGTVQCDSSFCLGDDTNEIMLDEGGDEGGSVLRLNFDGTLANPITVTADSADDASLQIAGDLTLDGQITMQDELNLFVMGEDHTATLNGNIVRSTDAALSIYGDTGYDENEAIFNGIISGDADIFVDGAHVRLAGSNTYTGSTELYDTGGGAMVTVVDNNSLGNSSAGTIVSSGTTLRFDNAGDITYEEPITVAGNGVGGSYPGALVKSNQYVALLGGVTLTGNTTWHNGSGENLAIISVISGDYDINVTSDDDSGGITLVPGGSNSFDDITVTGAQLSLYGAGDVVIPGNLTLNAVNGELSRIWMNNDNMMHDSTIITLNNDTSEEASLINTGVAETLGSIVGDGSISINDSDGQISLSNASGIFSGVLYGYANSQIQITGGTWTFSGRSQDVGDGYTSIYVNGGSFIADASDTSLGLSPFSISSGVLGGTGIIGPVSIYGGTVAPGNSPGCLYPDGDVAFSDPNGTYLQEIYGDTACTGYDVLNASGTVYLNDATLSVDLPAGVQLTKNHVYTIVQGSAVEGTFNGYADGDTVNVGAYPFRINYLSDRVTLTYIGETTTTSSDAVTEALADTGSSQNYILLAVFALVAGTSLTLILRLQRRYVL